MKSTSGAALRTHQRTIECLRRTANELPERPIVLDFGAGIVGASRNALRAGLAGHPEGTVHCEYDPLAPNPSRHPDVYVLKNIDELTTAHLVHLAYVLCHVKPDEVKALLEHLRRKFRIARFTFCEYTLRGFSPADAMAQLLQSTAEQKEYEAMHRLGQDFLEQHSRFDETGLCDTIESSGLSIIRADDIGECHDRLFIEAE